MGKPWVSQLFPSWREHRTPPLHDKIDSPKMPNMVNLSQYYSRLTGHFKSISTLFFLLIPISVLGIFMAGLTHGTGDYKIPLINLSISTAIELGPIILLISGLILRAVAATVPGIARNVLGIICAAFPLVWLITVLVSSPW